MDGKDVEDIFKDVLTDDSQTAHDTVLPHTNVNTVSSSTFPINHTPMNVHPVMVNNMQPGVISQTPATMMSPSHSGTYKNIRLFVSVRIELDVEIFYSHSRQYEYASESHSTSYTYPSTTVTSKYSISGHLSGNFALPLGIQQVS